MAKNVQSSSPDFSDALLTWYDQQARHLPWRSFWPALSDPYDVFLSELMLQQTVVATVIPYFQKFKEIWPTINDLAAAEEADILREWAGLGYYARARNMRKAAQAVVNDHDGIFPDDEAALLSLPGIGPYTAAAIMSFAFDKPAIVLDGNIERVLSRYFADDTPLPALKAHLRNRYPAIQPKERFSDFPQAMMDLGARICISGVPRCEQCPLSTQCASAFDTAAERRPVKAPKKAKPKREGSVFVARYDGKVAMTQRPDKGLLGGMMVFPTYGWWQKEDQSQGLADAPFAASWVKQDVTLTHVFTHFELRLTLYQACLTKEEAALAAKHFEFKAVEDVGLASIMAKVWRASDKQR